MTGPSTRVSGHTPDDVNSQADYRTISQLISKQHPSAFAQTDLQDHLKSLGLEKVVLVGYMVGLGLFYSGGTTG